MKHYKMYTCFSLLLFNNRWVLTVGFHAAEVYLLTAPGNCC